MQRFMLKSKIHRARVTDSNIEYEGSLTLDEGLMEAALLLPYEKIEVYNISNGKRFETYVIKGERGSGQVCVNGAAAHLASVGDLIIIASYMLCDVEKNKGMELVEGSGEAFKREEIYPRLIYLDDKNRIVRESQGW